MDNEKELLETEEVTEAQETEQEETEEESQEETTEEGEKDEESDESEKDDKADTKAEKRINKLTAINKSLQEQLAQAKDALDEAKETLERKDKALTEEKQAFATGFEVIHTRNGKQMFELTEEEFDEVVDICLANTDPEKGKQLLAECRAQRRQGKPLLKKQEEVDKGEQELWLHEWGLITTAVLDEETGNPELKKHLEKLASHISPIFEKRKEDKETAILYRQLSDGGVEAKMKHLTRLMKKLDLFKLVQTDAETPATIGTGKKAPAVTKEKTFTRAQIDAMSAAEFEKNEAAIDKAMAAGRIK